MARNHWVLLADATEQQQLKAEQTGERLQLNQPRDEPVAFCADCEIDHVKIRVPRFIWNFQLFWNRRGCVLREFRRARSSDNLICRPRDFICELARQKNGRL